MNYLVATVGIAIALMCIAGLARPPLIVDRFRALEITRTVRIVAILVRLVFGAALMLVAFDTAYPYTILVIGGLIVAAGIALIFIDEARLSGLVRFVLSLPAATLRVGFLAGLIFGLFLGYAVLT